MGWHIGPVQQGTQSDARVLGIGLLQLIEEIQKSGKPGFVTQARRLFRQKPEVATEHLDEKRASTAR